MLFNNIKHNWNIIIISIIIIIIIIIIIVLYVDNRLAN